MDSELQKAVKNIQTASQARIEIKSELHEVKTEIGEVKSTDAVQNIAVISNMYSDNMQRINSQGQLMQV